MIYVTDTPGPFKGALAKFEIDGVPIGPVTSVFNARTGEGRYSTSRNAREGRYMGKPFFRHARCPYAGVARKLNDLQKLYIARRFDHYTKEQA